MADGGFDPREKNQARFSCAQTAAPVASLALPDVRDWRGVAVTTAYEASDLTQKISLKCGESLVGSMTPTSLDLSRFYLFFCS